MKRVLFFSRGRGHGHAIPDMEIARVLKAGGADLGITFCSYATGFATFARHSVPAIDMGLPEVNPFFPTMVIAHDLIRKYEPDIVVAHEEFSALIAGRLLNCPTIYLSAWIPSGAGPAVDSMAYADGAVILENEGIFPIPSTMRVTPLYVGPIRRIFEYHRDDKLRAGRATCDPRARRAGDFQHRSRLPVHLRRVYPAAARSGRKALDGRQGPLPRQRLRRTALAHRQIRRDLPQELPIPNRGPHQLGNLLPLLQRAAPPQRLRQRRPDDPDASLAPGSTPSTQRLNREQHPTNSSRVQGEELRPFPCTPSLKLTYFPRSAVQWTGSTSVRMYVLRPVLR